MLAAVREMIRRRPLAGHEARTPDGMPSAWQATLSDEIALVLAVGAGDQRTSWWRWRGRWRCGCRFTRAALDAGILEPVPGPDDRGRDQRAQ